MKNGEIVSKDKGAAKFKGLNDDFDQCIIWDGNIGSLSISKKYVKGDELAMSLEQALKYAG